MPVRRVRRLRDDEGGELASQLVNESARQLILAPEKPGIESHLQNCLQLADMRQGTTSVVPQMAHSDSGFSRCGIANN
jgi:hypothetical protein